MPDNDNPATQAIQTVCLQARCGAHVRSVVLLVPSGGDSPRDDHGHHHQLYSRQDSMTKSSQKFNFLGRRAAQRNLICFTLPSTETVAIHRESVGEDPETFRQE